MKKSNELPKAICYARFSSNMQREESIDAQLRIINSFAESKYEIVKVYTDSAQSAMTDDRESFQEMIADVKNGNPYKAKVLLVSKRDRFSRNRYDTALYKRELAKAGISIVSATEHLDDSPESVILESVLDGMSEYFSLNVGRECLKGLKENAYTKRCTGSTAPLGLKVNKETLEYEIDEPNAQAIRLLFHHFVYDRWSYKQIADELNAKGYRTARGNLFNAKSSQIDLLVNEKYIGNLTYLKSRTNPVTRKRSSKRNYNRDEIIVTENAIPPIIDKETFNKAQEILAERKRTAGTFKAKNRKNLFTSKIYCGECGCVMNMNSRKSGKSKEYYSTYRCSSKNEKLAYKCSNSEISVSHLERYVLSQLMYYLKQDDTVDRIVNLLNENIANSTHLHDDEIKSIEQTILNNEVKIQNIANAIADGSVSVNVLLEKLKTLENDNDELKQRRMELTTITPTIQEVSSDEVRELIVQARTYMESEKDELIRVVINDFIEKIIVSKNGVEIIYYLQPFLYVRSKLWSNYVLREELSSYKGFLPKIMRGKWSRKSIISLSESKPPLAKVLSLVA